MPSPTHLAKIADVVESNFSFSPNLLGDGFKMLGDILAVSPGFERAKVRFVLNPESSLGEVTAQRVTFLKACPCHEGLFCYDPGHDDAVTAVYDSILQSSPALDDIHGRKARFDIATSYSKSIPPQNSVVGLSNSSGSIPSQDSGATGILQQDSIFQFHDEVFQSMQSQEFANPQDLAERLVLTVYTMSDRKPMQASPDVVRSRSEIYSSLEPINADLPTNISKNERPPSHSIIAYEQMSLSEYSHLKRSTDKQHQLGCKHRAYIALGSNIGDRVANIEQACNLMDARGLKVIHTSGLYETAPMYLEDQQSFINGACEVGLLFAIIHTLLESSKIWIEIG